MPDVVPQWLALPDDGPDGGPAARQCFVRLLDVIRHNLDDLFPGMTVRRGDAVPHHAQCGGRGRRGRPVRERGGKRWKRNSGSAASSGGPPGVRPGVQHPPSSRCCSRKLDLSELDLYEMPAELDFTDLFPIAGLNRPELRDPPWQPVVPPALADDDSDIFAVIRGGDFLVHHPYESFDATVERFIRQAAEDPKVLALKMTVYRVGTDTPFLDALIDAAEAGKQVACLVEVTARFDETETCRWRTPWTRPASTSSTASSASRRTARPPWWCGKTTMACAATSTSAPATTT